MLNHYFDANEAKLIRQLAESKLKGISKLFDEKHVVIAEGKHKEIFLLSSELFKVYKQLQSKHLYSLGLFFAEYDGSELKFSLPAISEYNKISSFHKVVIHKSVEQKFLFGRNLHNEVIISYDGNLRLNDTAVICNKHNEALGLGIVTGDFKSEKRVQVIKNTMDMVLYLRNKE
jgi:ribosome biogenesis protein Nip4